MLLLMITLSLPLARRRGSCGMITSNGQPENCWWLLMPWSRCGALQVTDKAVIQNWQTSCLDHPIALRRYPGGAEAEVLYLQYLCTRYSTACMDPRVRWPATRAVQCDLRARPRYGRT